MRRVALAAVAVAAALALAEPALACPACYGQADGPMIDAARLGTWLLLGVVLAVQAAFATFFLYLRRQAQRAQIDQSRPAPSGA